MRIKEKDKKDKREIEFSVSDILRLVIFGGILLYVAKEFL